MKKNKIGLILLMILLLLAIVLFVTNKPTTLKKDLSNFAVEDTASIHKIILKDKAGHRIQLDRVGISDWKVNDKYNARQDAVDNLLATIKQVTVKYPVNKAAFDNVLKIMASNSTKIEIYKEEETDPIKEYYVGNPNQNHDGTYMLMKNSSAPFVTHIEGFYGYLTTRYFTREYDWRDREIFASVTENIQSVKVEHPIFPETSFEITQVEPLVFRLTSLYDGKIIERFDTTKVFGYLDRFRKIHFEGFDEIETDEYVEAIKKSQVQYKITLTTKDGKTKEVKTFMKPATRDLTDDQGNPSDFDLDRMYALIDGAEFVVIQYFVFDNIKKDIHYFINK